MVESDLGGDVMTTVQTGQSIGQLQQQLQMSHQQHLLSKVTLPPYGQASIPIIIFSSTIKRSIGFLKLT